MTCLSDYQNLIRNNRTRTFFRSCVWCEIVNGTTNHTYGFLVSSILKTSPIGVICDLYLNQVIMTEALVRMCSVKKVFLKI